MIQQATGFAGLVYKFSFPPGISKYKRNPAEPSGGGGGRIRIAGGVFTRPCFRFGTIVPRQIVLVLTRGFAKGLGEGAIGPDSIIWEG